VVGAGPDEEPELGEDQAEELGELMAQLGLDERPARIITFLAHQGDGRSAEIEEACGLRQPQVSQATTRLEERGWLRTTTEKTPGKGRPVNVYSLAIGLGEIVEEVTARRREEINRDLARIERAQNLVDRARPEDAERARREAQN
jgi:predicted transcriptional regulator